MYRLYTHVKYLVYIAYMPNSVGIFVSEAYLAVTCEVEDVVSCVLAYICKSVGFTGPCRSMLIV